MTPKTAARATGVKLGATVSNSSPGASDKGTIKKPPNGRGTGTKARGS